MKKHVRVLSVAACPKRSESLLVTQQKVALWTSIFEAVGVLAEAVGSWVAIFSKSGESR